MPHLLEHHGELLERVLRHARLVPGLYLLLQVVLHPHPQLVQLVPLLGQPHRRVLRVPVVHDEVLLQDGTQLFNLLEVRLSGAHLAGLAANGVQLLLQVPGTLGRKK